MRNACDGLAAILGPVRGNAERTPPKPARFYPTILRLAGAILIAGALMAAAGPDVQALESARGVPVVPTPESPDTLAPSPVVLSIQSRLKEMGYYIGSVDGRLSGNLRRAIRTYQRKTGRRVTGKATKKLAEHLETQSRVGMMLQKLDKERTATREAARTALLQNESTRELLEEAKVEEVADPTRDSSSCFRNPATACLLDEAVESAKAIAKTELRDWALGEILVAQAKAGYVDAAIDTVRRMSDARLIIVALRDIARAQAQAGRIEGALAAAEIIPDRFKRLEALAAIADIQLENFDHDGAHETAATVISMTADLRDSLQRVTLLSQMAVILNRVGDTAGAEKILLEAQAIAASPALARRLRQTERGAALRHIASALAEINQPTRALEVIEEVTGAYDRTAVLMSAATAQARAKDFDGAMATAQKIDGARYKVVILGRIASNLSAAGHASAARDTIGLALEAAESIKLAYARSYAVGQLSLSLAEIGAKHGNGTLNQAVETANGIENGRIRAYALWNAAGALGAAGRKDEADAAKEMAVKATKVIGSSLSQVWMFGDIATENALIGNKERAQSAFARGISIAENIHNAWGRARALAKLALALSDLRSPIAFGRR